MGSEMCIRDSDKLGAGTEYASEKDVLEAFDKGELLLNSPVKVAGRETSPGLLRYQFASPDEAIHAVDRGEIDFQDHVTIRLNGELHQTSAGRVMFRRLVQEALGENASVVDELVRLDVAYEKDYLKDMVMACYRQLGIEATAHLLDALKDSGFKLSTTSGITIGTVSYTHLTLPTKRIV